MSARAAVVLVLLAPALAGCLRAADVGEADEAGLPAPVSQLAFAEPVLALDSCLTDDAYHCFEPSAAVDGGGRLFVMSSSGHEFAVSTDHGVTFATAPLPPVPDGAPLPRQTDARIQTDPWGRLYFTSQVGRGATLAPSFVHTPPTNGLQVARSADGGLTWAPNTLLILPETPSNLVLQDGGRQWLAFGEEDEVFLVYWQYLPTEVSWVARSTDGGATFRPFVPVADALAGYPAVTPGGTLVVPYFSDLGVRVALSSDRGQTFRHVQVSDRSTPFFQHEYPVAAVDEAGRLHIAWTTGANQYHPPPEANLAPRSGDVFVATSVDEGLTWSPVEQWGPGSGRAITTPPFAVARGGGLALMYFLTGGDVVVATQPASKGKPVRVGQAVGPNLVWEGMTDWAHFAAGPDGRLYVPFAHWERGVFVAVSGPLDPEAE